MRIVFFGTPEFAVPSLRALLRERHDVVGVVTQPDRPQGRSRSALVAPPVKAEAERSGIPVHQPARPLGDLFLAVIRRLEPDLGVVVAYGHILRPVLLALPRLGMINVHASLLPRWRGAAPIQRAILAGDRETGITIMQMDEGLDTGPMLLAERLPISPSDTGAMLHDRLAALGARLIVAALEQSATGRLIPTPQPASGATYAAKLRREDGRLDWREPAGDLARRVRALTPWPGAWCELVGERIKILAAEAVGAEGPPGRVLDDRLTIACGAGALRLLTVQRPGKAPLGAAEFLRGFKLIPGTVLA